MQLSLYQLIYTGGYRLCSDVQKRLKVFKDDHYTLLVGGTNLTIYCHLMNSATPREYLTLATGHVDNYAEIYDKTFVLYILHGTLPATFIHYSQFIIYSLLLFITVSRLGICLLS